MHSRFPNIHSIRRFGSLLALICLAWLPTLAQVADNTPGFIKNAVDLGPADPSTSVTVTVWLKLHNESTLTALVEAQHQKGNGQYHQWITQEQFNAQYGPAPQELKAVQNFLTAHKLTIVDVAENNMYVKVQGSIEAIQKTFHTQIHNFKWRGDTYRSNLSDPSINDKSQGLIAGITGLDDFGFRPLNVRPPDASGAAAPWRPLLSNAKGVFFSPQCFYSPITVSFSGASGTASYTGNRYGADITNNQIGTLPPCGYAPSEIQTAYGLNQLYSRGLTGAGQTIVIVDAYGSSTIQADAQLFSQLYGLPPVNLQIVKAPGLSNNPHDQGWKDETTLDVEWAHAVAPGANIALLVATDRASLDEAINYAVIHRLGNTISNSWGSLEGFGNPAQLKRVNRILMMAAAQGIDVNFASGDNGDESAGAGFKTVGFPASSPYATGVGGTSLSLDTSTNTIAFQTGWGNNLTMLTGTLAQGNPPVVPPLNEGFVFGAGGGASLTFTKPPFQSALPGSMRQVPDVAMLADPYTGVEIIETIDGQPSVGVIGGTSLACPIFSGIMAIAAQKAGHGLGQAAALLYNLPPGAVTDIVPAGSPSNVTGAINGSPIAADQLAAPLVNTTTYYSTLYNSPYSTRWFVLTFGTDSSLTTAPGWDNVTGVGTPNGLNFVNAIAP